MVVDFFFFITSNLLLAVNCLRVGFQEFMMKICTKLSISINGIH